MPNDNDEVVTSENNEELELVLDDSSSDDVQTEVVEKPQETLEQKKVRLSRQLEQVDKKLGITKEKTLHTQKTDVPDDIRKTVEKLSVAEAKRQFGYENGLSPEETDAVFGFNPNPTKETLKNPFVEGGLAKLRSQKRVNENTPSSSSRSGRPFSIKPDATLAEKQAEHERWTKNWTPKR
jgi:hypothetical protein